MKPLYPKKNKNRSKIEDCYLWRLVFLPILAGRLWAGGVAAIMYWRWNNLNNSSRRLRKREEKKTNERKSFKSTNGHYLSLKPFSHRNYPKKSQRTKKRTKLKSEYESESLRPQPLVHPVLLCLLSCNKWKNAKSVGSPGHNALHIISIRIWEVRLVWEVVWAGLAIGF